MKVGQPDKSFRGAVDWVADVLEWARTAKVRCVIDNPGHLLKPETTSRSTSICRKQMLVIPRQALMRVEGRPSSLWRPDSAGLMALLSSSGARWWPMKSMTAI